MLIVNYFNKILFKFILSILIVNNLIDIHKLKVKCLNENVDITSESTTISFSSSIEDEITTTIFSTSTRTEEVIKSSTLIDEILIIKPNLTSEFICDGLIKLKCEINEYFSKETMENSFEWKINKIENENITATIVTNKNENYYILEANNKDLIIIECCVSQNCVNLTLDFIETTISTSSIMGSFFQTLTNEIFNTTTPSITSNTHLINTTTPNDIENITNYTSSIITTTSTTFFNSTTTSNTSTTTRFFDNQKNIIYVSTGGGALILILILIIIIVCMKKKSSKKKQENYEIDSFDSGEGNNLNLKPVKRKNSNQKTVDNILYESSDNRQSQLNNDEIIKNDPNNNNDNKIDAEKPSSSRKDVRVPNNEEPRHSKTSASKKSSLYENNSVKTVKSENNKNSLGRTESEISNFDNNPLQPATYENN